MTESLTKVLAKEQLMPTHTRIHSYSAKISACLTKESIQKAKYWTRLVLNGLEKSTLNSMFHPHYLLGWYYLEESAGGYEHFLWFSALNLASFSSLPGNPQPACPPSWLSGVPTLTWRSWLPAFNPHLESEPTKWIYWGIPRQWIQSWVSPGERRSGLQRGARGVVSIGRLPAFQADRHGNTVQSEQYFILNWFGLREIEFVPKSHFSLSLN